MTQPSVIGLSYLRDFATKTIHVYRDSDDIPGAGIYRPLLNKLLAAGLITLGDPTPKKGRPVRLTPAGRALLEPSTNAQLDLFGETP